MATPISIRFTTLLCLAETRPIHWEYRSDNSLSLLPRLSKLERLCTSSAMALVMVKAVFDELNKPVPQRHFTVGIIDDVTHTSLPWDPSYRIEAEDVSTALFYGLGADGTVGANKNSIKIIGHETDRFVQGYFVYDSKKSGAITVSHLRTSPRPIRSAYLIERAGFVACHQFEFIDKIDMLEFAATGAVFLLNASGDANSVWDRLPREMQQQLIDKRIRFFVIDAYALAKQAGMGGRINTIMQTCFFAISGVLPREEAIEKIKDAVIVTYGRKGAELIERNFAAIDRVKTNSLFDDLLLHLARE